MKFNDALDHSIKMFSSSSFIQRIKDEDDKMLQHLNILKKINNLGYLTTESQAGLKRKGLRNDNKHYEIFERAYLTGFMLEKNAIEFIKKMSIYTDKNTMFVPYCNNNVYVPGNLDIPLTISRINKEITVETHTSAVLPEYVWDMYRKQAHINKSEKIVFIICWDSKWNRNASGRDGLFTDIVRILRKL